MRNIITTIAIFFFSTMITGCSSSDVKLVKKGNFYGYPNVTIEQLLESSFENTSWYSEKTDKGEVRILFKGKIPKKLHDTLKEKKIRIAIDNELNRNETDIYTLSCGRVFNTVDILFFIAGLQKDYEPVREIKDQCNQLYRNDSEKQYDPEFNKQILEWGESILDRDYWTTGGTVEIEWAISSNKKNFDLVRYGSDTLISNNFNEFLEIIYKH